MRIWLLTALILALASAGCYDASEPDGEDYDGFHEVFAGAGPNDDGEDLVFKLSYDMWGDIEGEAEGPFFSRLDGRYVDGGQGTHITLEARFRSNACEGVTNVEFEGTINNDELTGVMYYKGCTVYQFYYEGELIGGVGR